MSTDDVLSSIDEALWWEENWQEASAMRWTPDLPEENSTQASPLYRSLQTFAETFDPAPLNRAFRRMAAAIAEMVRPLSKIFERMSHTLPDHNSARCRTCSPRANPEPLCINGRPFGAEYARRRKARGRA